MRKEHTPGESKKRNQARSDTRSAVAICLQNYRKATVKAMSWSLNVPYQRVVSALNQLVKAGFAVREAKGVYRDVTL